MRAADAASAEDQILDIQRLKGTHRNIIRLRRVRTPVGFCLTAAAWIVDINWEIGMMNTNVLKTASGQQIPSGK